MTHSFHRDDATFAQVDYADLTGTAPSQITIANNRVLGNVSGITAPASALTGTQVTSLLDTFTGSLKGLAPAGSGSSTDYLGGDGSFHALPPVSAAYVHISTTAVSADVSVTGLANYSSLIVVGRAVTCLSSVSRVARVSVDNGSSYLNTSGDYISIAAATGVESNFSQMTLSDASQSARGFWLYFPIWNVANAGKIVMNSGTLIPFYLPTTSALNAIQLSGNGGPINGGSIDVFGIPA